MLPVQTRNSSEKMNRNATENYATSANEQSWQTDCAENLQMRIDEARSSGKHLFVWDRTGQVPMHFENFGINKEFTVEMVSVALADVDVHTVLDSGLQGLRSALAESLSTGNPLLINLGMLAPDFKSVYAHPEIFPSNTIFSWSRL